MYLMKSTQFVTWNITTVATDASRMVFLCGLHIAMSIEASANR
jgi:hypothetical protein